MDSSIFKKASEYLGEKNKHRQWKITVTALAAVVIIATAYILSKPAQTLVNNIYCGMEEHTHTEECYGMELVCGYADLEILPSDGQDSASQGTQDSAAPDQGTTSGTAHQHDESCYVEEKELICGQEESTGHTHTDACKTITENRELTCGQEESTGHTHTDACKTVTENRELTCGLAEGIQADGTEHSHGDACYTVNQTEQITCGQEESAGHSHADACYTVKQAEQITCGQEESTGHTHTDACYQTVRKLACGQEEGTTVAEGQADATGTDYVEGTGVSADSTASKTDASTEGTTENTDNGGSAPADTDAAGTASAEGSADAAGTTPAEDNAEGAAHVHTEECYAQVLTCKTEEHIHGDQCYKEVFCGIQGHTHSASCYDEEDNLICEITEHKHEANCYKEPHCGFTAHIHGAGCYDENGSLTCGMEEHTHVDECYISNTYYCTGRIHVHTNACYDLEGNLRCGSADYWVHSHGETCYDKNERLICTLPEREEVAEGEEGTLHTHTEECYGVRGVLICGQTEVIRHNHDDTCRMEPSEPWTDTTSVVAYCGMPAHTHQDSCKDSEGNVICGLEEHTHTEECFEETGYNCISQIHIHEADCYDKDGNIQCGLADYVLHVHGPLCYGMDGKLLCTLEEIVPHVHGPECYSQETVETEASAEDGEPVEGQEAGQVMTLICTLPEAEVHEHTGACRDENGSLVCGKLQTAEHEHTEDCIIDAADIEITQSFKGADFIVTATYNKKEANLPEEAVLFAERITAEGNEEYYARRAAQYQEMQGEDDDNTMQALLRIGFTAEGAEVEPEAPVTITVQFLDENGMAEGSPVTVVHFGEAGNERIEGTNAEKNSTTFQMNSFSEIALGWKIPAKTVTVDKTFTYEDDAFTVKFHVEGEATLPTEEEIEEAKQALDNATVSDGDAEGTVSGSDAEETAPGEESQDAIAEIDSEVTSEDLEAVVEPLGEDTEKYEEALGHAAEADIDDEILSFQVLSYALTYEGAKLDLTGCKVTVEVTPTDALVEFAENSEANVMAISDEEANKEQTTEDPEVFVVAMNSEGAIFDTLTVSKDASMVYETTAQGKENEITTYATSQANPQFTVQYYANIEVLATEGPIALNVIDTTGGNLPQNTPLERGAGNIPTPADAYEKFYRFGDRYRLRQPTNARVKNIYIDNGGNVVSNTELIAVYADREYHYIEAPNLIHFNRLAENTNYELSEIWVGKKVNGEDPTSWNKYTDLDKVHFTNRSITAAQDDYVLIENDTVIRLIYVTTTTTEKNPTTFYDYDITDGKVYKTSTKRSDGTYVLSNQFSRGEQHRYNDVDDEWYVSTGSNGINSYNTNLKFGNDNTQTGFGDKGVLGNNYLNRINMDRTAKPYAYLGYEGCTFGLVSSLNQNGTIKYTVTAPALFNEAGGVTGKEVYGNTAEEPLKSALTFRRTGDTYTLTDATVAGESIHNLDRFNQPTASKETEGGANKNVFYTNNFWPMDNVASAGTEGHDPMFGTKENTTTDHKLYAVNGTNQGMYPTSDDYQIHNSYFGMYYTVDFKLTDDYIGPLEYLFYGDDDMWVFLSKLDANGNLERLDSGDYGKLICDIGGVHSSVGEYVNLWDYIDQGDSGSYRLSFFYTERGASGSTCWMQFTLPSVSFSTPKQNTGQIRIEKEVTGTQGIVKDEEFGFEIEFKDSKGNKLQNDYAYTKYTWYDENGDKLEEPMVVSKDILIWTDAKFTLKKDEYIEISYLPDGTTYTIKEIGPVELEKDEDGKLLYDENGNVVWRPCEENPYYPMILGGNLTGTDGEVTGTVSSTGGMVVVKYNNVCQYKLPETGGTGLKTLYALAGVLSILFGAGLVYRKKFRERRA